MEPSRGKSICIPFKSEDHYAICVVDPDRFRHYGFQYHDNWLHNLLIASSMGGRKL